MLFRLKKKWSGSITWRRRTRLRVAWSVIDLCAALFVIYYTNSGPGVTSPRSVSRSICETWAVKLKWSDLTWARGSLHVCAWLPTLAHGAPPKLGLLPISGRYVGVSNILRGDWNGGADCVSLLSTFSVNIRPAPVSVIDSYLWYAAWDVKYRFK